MKVIADWIDGGSVTVSSSSCQTAFFTYFSIFQRAPPYVYGTMRLNAASSLFGS